MARIGCFSTLLLGKKKKSKVSPKSFDVKITNDCNINENREVKTEEFICSPIDNLNTREDDFLNNVKAVANVTSVRADSTQEAPNEGGNEKDAIIPMKKDFSEFDLQEQAEGKEVLNYNDFIDRVERNVDLEIGQNMELSVAPLLKRSCSNIETKRYVSDLLDSPMRSRSYDDLRNLSGNVAKETPNGIAGSPLSVKTSVSADLVMLKKRSSRQLLPSRSRKLWWKLFLWSHRNLHKTWGSKPQMTADSCDAADKKGGYTSDTLEMSHVTNTKKNKAVDEPQNQWVAFDAESSSLDRVNAWVHSLDDSTFCLNCNEGNEIEGEEDEGTMFGLCSTEIGESSGKNQAEVQSQASDEIVQANTIIQSMNILSSVAHISGMGLKVIPPISAFTSLRAINLSNNFIVHVSPGSLPKSLHTLDLSKNKIASIEGLRELTKLRFLNLSYNRITRIGHGLSNCTAIKELYLAGNKISEVEGLHRLLKLAVLDLSFNRITTTRDLGQLVANYNSLLALNLLGNPIQSNIGDDQLRKATTGLLPHLAYLNKQPIKPPRTREVASDSVAKAAMGTSSWGSRRKLTRRLSQTSSGSSTLIKSRPGEGASHRGLGAGAGLKSSRHSSRSMQQLSSYARK